MPHHVTQRGSRRQRAFFSDDDYAAYLVRPSSTGWKSSSSVPSALVDLRVALDDGVHPSPDEGLPELLAATDEECGYAWGIADGRHLRAEALLLQAGQTLGRADFAPANADKLPADVQALINSARGELQACRDLRTRIQDPKVKQTEELLAKLERGFLTEYPFARTPPDQIEPQEELETMPAPIRHQVFICYSHRDKRWLDDLLIHLKPYLRDGSITAWSDRQIRPGHRWFEEIQGALAATKVAVLLVTPNFLASDFIHENELAPLQQEAKRGGVRILWIPVRASAYWRTGLQEYQAVADPDKPLANMKAERDRAWVKICEQIEEAVNAP